MSPGTGPGTDPGTGPGTDPGTGTGPGGRRHPATAVTVTQLGEAFVGHGAEAAHLNTVLGALGGPVETAWATALATPRQGHAAFVAVVRPGLPARPPTLFVNKAPIEDPGHGRLTWGAAQAGVAAGVADAVADGVVPVDQVGRLLLIAAVWVDPGARDEELVYANNRLGVYRALVAGRDGTPGLDEVLAARQDPANPYFRSGGTHL